MRGLFAGLFVLLVLVSLYEDSPIRISGGGGRGSQQKISMFDPVDPSVIQDTISEIQQKEQSVYPVDTVYFNRSEGGGYQARFLFLDTSNYAGVQYDVNVDSDGKISGQIQKSVPANFQNPFSGYVKNFKFGTLNVVPPVPDMKKVWDNFAVRAQ
jgi:hypothetical protein